MPAVTVRNISDETHRALKRRAIENGRSTEAEIRDILDSVVRPKDQMGLGDELAAIGRQFGGIDFNIERDKTVTDPISFE